MFREPKPTAESILELIRTLPKEEQKAIAKTLTEEKKGKTKKSRLTKAERIAKIKRFEKYVSKHRVKLPKNYKFDREEANRRYL